MVDQSRSLCQSVNTSTVHQGLLPAWCVVGPYVTLRQALLTAYPRSRMPELELSHLHNCIFNNACWAALGVPVSA